MLKKISFRNRLFKQIKSAYALLKLKFKRVTFIMKKHFDEKLGNCYDGYFKCYTQ